MQRLAARAAKRLVVVVGEAAEMRPPVLVGVGRFGELRRVRDREVGVRRSVEDGVFLSGNTAVHQFVRLGRLSLLSGVSATSKDVPPFIVQQHHNCVVGVNVVGMRRAGHSAAQIDAVIEGKPKQLNSRYTDVWRKGPKGWQMVAWQSTPIPA